MKKVEEVKEAIHDEVKEVIHEPHNDFSSVIDKLNEIRSYLK